MRFYLAYAGVIIGLYGSKDIFHLMTKYYKNNILKKVNKPANAEVIIKLQEHNQKVEKIKICWLNPVRVEVMTNLLLYSFFPTLDNILKRLLANTVFSGGGLCLHASGVKYHSRAFIFMGQSGAGKSTVLKSVNKMDEIIADNQIMISWNDKMCLCYPNIFLEAGSYFGREQIDFDPIPIEGLVVLSKTDGNKMSQIPMRKFLRLLNVQVHIPEIGNSKVYRNEAKKRFLRLTGTTRLCLLEFNKKINIKEVLDDYYRKYQV